MSKPSPQFTQVACMHCAQYLTSTPPAWHVRVQLEPRKSCVETNRGHLVQQTYWKEPGIALASQVPFHQRSATSKQACNPRTGTRTEPGGTPTHPELRQRLAAAACASAPCAAPKVGPGSSGLRPSPPFQESRKAQKIPLLAVRCAQVQVGSALLQTSPPAPMRSKRCSSLKRNLTKVW